MSYPCPRCHDRNTQKLSLMYESNTRRWRDFHGRDQISQSDLTKKYAPPEPEDTPGSLLLLAILSLILFLTTCRFFAIHTPVAFMEWLPFFVVVLSLWLWMFRTYRRIRGDSERIYLEALAQWQSSFLCRACECVFIPQNFKHDAA